MEILATPDVYQPSMDNNGNYVDKIPSFMFLNNGLRCPCGNHDGYKTAALFRSHIKTVRHAMWLEQINQNKHNIYVEYENLRLVVEQQRKQLIEKELVIREKENTIRALTVIVNEKIEKQLSSTVENLMFLD